MTGFLNIDKRYGDTSTFVVNKIKRYTKTPCGHMGTLDPLASGVLPVGVGNATRLFDYFLEKQKTYTARFRFGATTDTLDNEGEIVVGGSVPSRGEIEQALPSFIGKIEQIPPKFSARCINGKRGYELARKGTDFDLPPKQVEIFSLEVVEQTAADEYEFQIVCGAGTYIRSLSRDIAAALKTQGYTTMLRRTASGIFTEQTSVPLEMLTSDNISDYLIPTESVLPFPRLDVADERYFNGVRYEVGLSDGIYKVYRENEFYGLARVVDGIIRAEKKLC